MTKVEEKISKDSKNSKTLWQQFKENIQVIAIALILALGIRLWVAEPRYIPSDSMLPTLEQGDRLVVEKLSYRFHSPQRGDIIVFKPPAQLQRQGYKESQAFIKRIIATPGETVAVVDGKVYLNNQPLEESYPLESPYYNLPPVTVPPGDIFVLGDNRNNSNDSHIWGFLPQSNIIGHAIFRFFPFDRIGIINNGQWIIDN
jgi:signal peptidase I